MGVWAFGDVTCNKQKVICPPPPLLLLPSIKVTGSALAKCVVTEALQVYCKQLESQPLSDCVFQAHTAKKIIKYFLRSNKQYTS